MASSNPPDLLPHLPDPLPPHASLLPQQPDPLPVVMNLVELFHESEAQGQAPLTKTEEKSSGLKNRRRAPDLPLPVTHVMDSSPGLVSFSGDKKSTHAKVVVGPSWAAVVQPKPAMKKYEICVEEINGVHTTMIPDEVMEDAVPLWEDFVVGKFPSDAPHVARIHKLVNRIWTLGDKSIKIDVFVESKTVIKFKIPNVHIRNRVLRRQMWNIVGLPMMVSKCSPVVITSNHVCKASGVNEIDDVMGAIPVFLWSAQVS